jgi:hypothetical protein
MGCDFYVVEKLDVIYFRDRKEEKEPEKRKMTIELCRHGHYYWDYSNNEDLDDEKNRLLREKSYKEQRNSCLARCPDKLLMQEGEWIIKSKEAIGRYLSVINRHIQEKVTLWEIRKQAYTEGR